ncbi:esterase-like activity of phytase family protein [Kitasatospora sp. NBC_01560]|uniref:esterase-like activity of phytase family protein n=1 Tax=Kitasatospora sp. NBC_01560 TaxID=2975965 RepID=UPI0038684270
MTRLPRPFRARRRWIAAAAAVLAASCGAAAAGSPAASAREGGGAGRLPDVRLLDTLDVPGGAVEAGQPFGGLSGIDYDRATGRYVALSDDRSELAPARFFTLRLPLGAQGFAARRPVVESATVLTGPDGQPYPRRSVDPEAIRWAPGGRAVLWASEGVAAAGVPPFVRTAGPDGAHRGELPVPAAYRPVLGDGGAVVSGVRDNQAWEGLTLSPDGATVVTLTEDALAQDGPVPGPAVGSRSRLLRQDRAGGRTTGEFVYPQSPLAEDGTGPAPAQQSGASELLAVNETDYLVVERTAFTGRDFGIRIYWTTTVGATDVAGRRRLDGSERVMRKKLLFDFATTGVRPDNVEGLTWGPRLADGSRSLVLVTDDNFGTFGSPGTRFHLLAVRPGLLAEHTPDLDRDGTVGPADLRRLLRSGPAGDLDGSGRNDGRDAARWASYARAFPFPH